MTLGRRIHNLLITLANTAYYAGESLFHRREQKDFENHYLRFKKLYTSLDTKNTDSFVVPFWRSRVGEMEEIFLTALNDSFLKNEVIKKTMFITNRPSLRNEQLKFLKSQYSKKDLRYLLKEPAMGQPLIEDWIYQTSHNSIHHLSHLATFSDTTKVDLGRVQKVIEWGGGYGNMARLMKKLNPRCTYVIIDLPVFSMLQASYLSTVLGKGSVKVITSPGEPLQEGSVNLVPLTSEQMLHNASLTGNSLFMSTWALTESSEYALRFVQEKRYFDSDYLLMAHVDNNSKISEATNTIMSNLGSYTVLAHEPIPRLDSNFYLFCKKS